MVARRGRLGTREDGLTLIIVALALVALMGMLVLVIDVGGVLYRRLELRNSADAAALAAAISCGNKEGLDDAMANADLYAADNSLGAVVADGFPVFSPSCEADSGTVRVRVTADQDLSFAPVLGFDGQTAVAAEATAIWGGAGTSEHVAPLMLSANRLSDCNIPPPNNEVIEQDCTFWWDNSPGSSSDPVLTNAEWGTLDLLKWDVTPETGCDNSTPPQFEEWMLEGFVDPLPINGDDGMGNDPPTYVCRGQGNFGAALDKDIEDVIELQIPLYFPVNQPLNQIDRDGNVCVPPDLGGAGDCSVDKYDIIGFARMRIIALYKGRSDEAEELCVNRLVWAEADANARCMLARWIGYTNEGLNPESGENFGIVPVRLIE